MSSTTNIQNLLVNVFRPVYTYDGATSNFIPKLTMSNINTYSGNVISVFNANIADSNFNVYIGSNAGNSFSSPGGCSNNTTLGYQAGYLISNVSNSIYLGYAAAAYTQDASGVIAIGVNSKGGGSNNIYIGNNTGTTTSNVGNIFIGNNITAGATISNSLRIGTNTHTLVSGVMTNNYVGINLPTPAVNFDVSGESLFRNKVGIQYPDMNSVTKSLQVNGQTLSTGGYSSIQGSNTFTGTVTIGELKRGIVLVSAVDTGNSANRAARNMFAFTTSNITNLGNDISAGTAIITTSTSNIVLSNSGASSTYNWNITYFPIDAN
jgi:hypothetical protein